MRHIENIISYISIFRDVYVMNLREDIIYE